MKQIDLSGRQHPIARALLQALGGCGGGLTAADVAVAACVFPYYLRQQHQGEFLHQRWWGHRADAPIYPASVMKLFLLNMLAAKRDEGAFVADDEDLRAAREMITTSSNEATVYIMGRLTGAEDGGNLPPEALQKWCAAREGVQKWYEAQNRPEYAGVQLYHATYYDSPYGRARAARDILPGNKLTALSGAALIYDIARGARPNSDWMMALAARDFQRDPNNPPDPEGDQVRGFWAEGVPASARVWSKSGHTSWTRHDLAYVECENGHSYVICVMCDSRWAAADHTFLPAFAKSFHDHAFAEISA